MDEMEQRLAACFVSVLPDLSPDEIRDASASTVASWDSVATVTLLAVVEEEFGISIADEDPARFDSFKNILSYLQQVAR
ncbi:MAG TPA: acyl carrier protein [Candidatus Dormibacteraeota bacterium]|nr:acyl carrier protein [Candidatus Dormibacteraeota bacterium]